VCLLKNLNLCLVLIQNQLLPNSISPVSIVYTYEKSVCSGESQKVGMRPHKIKSAASFSTCLQQSPESIKGWRKRIKLPPSELISSSAGKLKFLHSGPLIYSYAEANEGRCWLLLPKTLSECKILTKIFLSLSRLVSWGLCLLLLDF